MKIEKCPNCGNEHLKVREQLALIRVVSARTGKVLKDEGAKEIVCWNHFCKCGWEEELQVP